MLLWFLIQGGGFGKFERMETPLKSSNRNKKNRKLTVQ
jgi:hypothetical protein